jgi:hypothetical protein
MGASRGIDGLTGNQLVFEVQRGAKFVMFDYCVSAIFVTFRRSSDVYFIRPDESAFTKGLPFTLLSLAFGWWGFPFGVIYTPVATIYKNLRGGRNMTDLVMSSFAKSMGGK